MNVNDILKKVLQDIVPDEKELDRAKKAEVELKKRLESLEVEYIFVGSYPRNTWIKGNLEIDVFIMFPPHLDKGEMEARGLEIGKMVLDSYEIRYAEHPYVHGKIFGVEVDVVPCYKISDPRKIKSAVDRTPFHHSWLKDKIKGKENEVRLLKKFLKSNGIYGAEYKVRGFSGYLCELLIVFFGSFLDVIRSATKWTRRTVIDVAKGEIRRGKCFFVVDPVDEKRNVAANLSIDNLARFVQLCRDFMTSPSLEYFYEKRIKVSSSKLKSIIEKRNSVIFLVKFRKPDIVEDNLYPQLEKASRKVFSFLERERFMPLRSSYVVGGEYCYLLFECQVVELSRIFKKMGPPFEEEDHVRRFLSKKRDFRPFLENGRWWVYDYREFSKPEEAVANYIRRNWKSMGKNVGEELAKWFTILSGSRIIEEEISEHLYKFLGVL
ncbi:CCA tRNA nucleotidyltransferase [Archaeoglobales archaeon]|nr:MAG: CCA tRNA nucleotidyltransferase [Archaeoglobales archaeon]